MSGVSSKILIIEDEATVRSGLEDNLVLEGYTVVATDGTRGLELFQSENPPTSSFLMS